MRRLTFSKRQNIIGHLEEMCVKNWRNLERRDELMKPRALNQVLCVLTRAFDNGQL